MDSRVRPIARYIGGIVLAALAYALLARAGYEIAPGAERISPIWLPGALALAALLLYGLRAWPVALLGPLLFVLGLDLPPAHAAAICAGNLAGPLAGAWLLAQADFDPALRSFRDANLLMGVGGVLANAVGALAGGLVLALAGTYESAQMAAIVQLWFLAGIAGVLTLTPFLLAAAGHGLRADYRARAPELAALAVLFLLACTQVFAWSSAARGDPLPGYAIFPFVIWAALRFDQLVTGALVVLATLFAIIGSIQGYIPFEQYYRYILFLQLFIGLLAACGLLLATSRQRQLASAREADALFQLAGAGMMRTGLDGRFLAVNDTLAGWLGWRPQELAGRRAADFLHPDEPGNAPGGGDHAAGSTAMRCTGRDGRVRWLQASTAPYRDETGQPRWHNTILQDVSEQVAAEAALREQRDRLEQEVARRTADLSAANRELEAFSRSVSHDLRTPLAGFIGLTTLLRADHAATLDDTGREYLAMLQESAEAMSDLVESLLRLSLAQQRPLQVEPLDLSTVAREVAELLLRQGGRSDVVLDIAPGLRVQGDASLVRILLQNLVANALKFSSRRDAPLVRIGMEHDADGRCWIHVTDNGAGFDQAEADRLFQPFHRLHEGEGYAGTGIGLATVRRIVERHGGRLRAEGRRGEGARFLFWLPH